MAGVTAQIDLQLRDYYRNRLISGGRDIELALLGVGGTCIINSSFVVVLESVRHARRFALEIPLLIVFFSAFLVIVDWGTPQPLPLHQGLPNQPYYRGNYFLF